MNGQDFWDASSVGVPLWIVKCWTAPDELEVLTWSEIWLLEVYDPSEKLEHTDGRLGMQ